MSSDKPRQDQGKLVGPLRHAADAIAHESCRLLVLTKERVADLLFVESPESEDEMARIGQEHGDAAKLVSDVQTDVDNIKRFIASNDIVRLPDPDLCQVVEMPEFQRGNSTAYMNSPPPLDSKASGYFAVSPPPMIGMPPASPVTLRNTTIACSKSSQSMRPIRGITCNLNTPTRTRPKSGAPFNPALTLKAGRFTPSSPCWITVMEREIRRCD